MTEFGPAARLLKKRRKKNLREKNDVPLGKLRVLCSVREQNIYSFKLKNVIIQNH